MLRRRVLVRMADRLQHRQLNIPVVQQRPKDPNRFGTIDVASSTGQQDPQYQRMVADIEALQQRQGWLAGGGAFDKDDLLYLRDKEQEQRHAGRHNRSAEAAAFAAERARAEMQLQQQSASTLRGKDVLLPAPTRTSCKRTPEAQISVVSVKPRKQQQQQHCHQQQQYDDKRQEQQQASADPSKKQQHCSSEAKRLPTVLPSVATLAQEPANKKQRMETTAQNESCAVDLQTRQSESAKQHDENSLRDAVVTEVTSEPLRLLCDYGSDDADDADGQQADSGSGVQQAQKQICQFSNTARVSQLPSAHELLQSKLQSSIQQPVNADAGAPALLPVCINSPLIRDLGSWV